MSIAPDDEKLLRTLANETVSLENVGADVADRLRIFEDAGLVRAVRSETRSYMVLTGPGILAARPHRDIARRAGSKRKAFVSLSA